VELMKSCDTPKSNNMIIGPVSTSSSVGISSTVV
jgi:hypothetical protein